MENPKGDAMDEKRAKLEPSEPLHEYDYYPGDDYDQLYHPGDDDDRSADEVNYHLFSPLAVILKIEKAEEELLDMVRLLVKEHPELIPSAKELLEALLLDETTKHAEKAIELLKNHHVRQGFARIFHEGHDLVWAVDTLAQIDNVQESTTFANRVAFIRRDPLLGEFVSGKEDVDIMRGAFFILVGYWIDQRLASWLYKQATNLILPESERYTNPPPF